MYLLVIGGNSDIGYAIAEKFYQIGYNIYLTKIINFQNKEIDKNNIEFKEYEVKQNSNNKKSILKSYDILLNEKYNITLNQKTIARVENYFQ